MESGDQFKIAAVCFAFASACFFAGALANLRGGTGAPWSVLLCLGSAFLCFAAAFLNKNKQN